MPLTIESDPGRRLRFRLDGALATPSRSPRWRAASPRQRLRYFPVLAETLLDAWHDQMLEGRGRRGKVRSALPISRLAYRQAGLESTGPGLLPQSERSRAYRHARVTPYPDLGRVTGYFGHGTGRFLSYHHEGLSGRGRMWLDDLGRIHWAGIPGAVTGIVRDLMPTLATINAAVADAEREWAAMVGLVRRRDMAGGSGNSGGPGATPDPAGRPGTPRRRRQAARPGLNS